MHANGDPPHSTRLLRRNQGDWTVHLRVAAGQRKRMNHAAGARWLATLMARHPIVRNSEKPQINACIG
jgi:hypothetical protein